jgi:hypothetical protein
MYCGSLFVSGSRVTIKEPPLVAMQVVWSDVAIREVLRST